MYAIGFATRQIVPDRPAMLQGQMHVRVARQAMDPLTVTAVAIEGGRPRDAAAIVSFDLAMVADSLQTRIRQWVGQRVPELAGERLILCATHTHTSLVYVDGFYVHPGGDVMAAPECESFLVERGAEAVIEAWKARAPARIGRAFGHAVVAHNRRAVYRDGSSRMYGQTSQADFQWIEGFEDHSLDMLPIWDAAGRLTGIVLCVPCPSQVDEHLSVYSADYWHEVRLELRRRLGDGLFVVPMCGAAGDQSPHFMLYGQQEKEMRQRLGVTERQEIAHRVADAVQRALACTEPMADVSLRHVARVVDLSPRQVSPAERDFARAERERAVQSMDPRSWWPARLQHVVDLAEGRASNPPLPTELHALRLGDAVLVTNPFELYVDFGLRIKTRSAAAQTIVAQLTSGTGWYLPTQRAVQGGGYGAMPAVCKVGPEGGDELVEHSLAMIGQVLA